MKTNFSSKFFLNLDYYLLSQFEKDFPIKLDDFIVFSYLLFCWRRSKTLTYSNNSLSKITRVSMYGVKNAIINLEEWGLIVVTRTKNIKHNFKIDRSISISPFFLKNYELYDDCKVLK